MYRRGTDIADRRVQKTQNLLRGALHSLLSEKPYDRIVVKEILDRANVGRSTFYTHFHDKDELLASSIYDMVHSVRPSLPPSGPWYERILWFSLPMFEYHNRHHRERNASIGPQGSAVLHEHLQRALVNMIAEAVDAEFPVGRKAKAMPRPLLVEYVASTFILVFNRWLAAGGALSPEAVNDLFRALVLPTLAEVGRAGL